MGTNRPACSEIMAACRPPARTWRTVAQVARVLHVHRDRIGAAQLVADVLRRDRRLEPELLEALSAPPLEDLADVHLGGSDVPCVQKRLKEFGLKATIAAKNIGYELRCADPIPMDMEYTRDLGYCAAKYVLGGGNAA